MILSVRDGSTTYTNQNSQILILSLRIKFIFPNASLSRGNDLLLLSNNDDILRILWLVVQLSTLRAILEPVSILILDLIVSLAQMSVVGGEIPVVDSTLDLLDDFAVEEMKRES